MFMLKPRPISTGCCPLATSAERLNSDLTNLMVLILMKLYRFWIFFNLILHFIAH